MVADLPRTLFLSLLLTGAEVGAQSLVVVPEKTPVVVEVLEDLSSATAVRGQRFAIRLAEPIEQDGAVIIPPGATGQGEVVHSAKPKGAGKPGELILAARHLDWQGVRIPLRGFDAAQVGKDRNEDVTAVSVLFIGMGGFFIKGGNMVAGTGTRGIARVASDVALPGPAEATAPAP